MSSRKNPSTKKSVNRARKANGNVKNAPRNASQNRAFGGGNRKESAPISSAFQQTTRNPGIVMAKDGTKCRVVQRELIDVLSVAAPGFQIPANVGRLRCNPGSAKTFPWLSTMANSWETYRFKRLSFESIARCPTTTAGSVIMSPDYDAQDGQPLSETQMSQMKGTQEGAPWQNIRLNLNPAAMNRSYKAHTTMDDSRFASTTQDEKTLDVAQVFIATDCDSVLKISKIWVDYDVELFTPQPPNLALDQGGGVLAVGVSAENPLTNGSLYTNSVGSVLTSQSTTNPLFAVVNNSGGTPGPNLVKMLRDWTGDLDYIYNTTTANAFAAVPSLYKNGVSITSTESIPLSYVKTMLNAVAQTSGSGQTYSSGKSYTALSLKAGDLIGINPAGISLANTAAAVDSFLKFGANLYTI